MVSGISSNSASLNERMNAVKAAGNLKPIDLPGVEESLEISLTGHLIESKEDLWASGVRLQISSLDMYVSFRNQMTDTTGMKEDDYQLEYQEYMKKRDCNSSEELEILNHNFCNTKADFLDKVKHQIKAITNSIEYSSGISISDDQISSILTNASLKNLNTYISANSNTISESALNFQTLLNNICKQDNIGGSLKSSLSSLSNSISNASDMIGEYSDEVARINAQFSLNNTQRPIHNPSLIANYKS